MLNRVKHTRHCCARSITFPAALWNAMFSAYMSQRIFRGATFSLSKALPTTSRTEISADVELRKYDESSTPHAIEFRVCFWSKHLRFIGQ